MASTTRDKLIAAANQRFYRDGFRNVGLDQILADVGISKTAFYKHFESKDDLMLAVLEAQDRWLRDTLRRVALERGGESPGGQLRALFDVVEQILGMEAFRGCFFVNAAIEFPLPHEPAHIAAANNKAAVEEIVRELAERAGATDPTALAEDVCLIMEGAYITKHVTGKRTTGAIARRMADRVISGYLDLKG